MYPLVKGEERCEVMPNATGVKRQTALQSSPHMCWLTKQSEAEAGVVRLCPHANSRDSRLWQPKAKSQPRKSRAGSDDGQPTGLRTPLLNSAHCGHARKGTSVELQEPIPTSGVKCLARSQDVASH